MILVLWLTLYWKWFLLGASIPLVIHFCKIVKQAREERKEEAEFVEIEASPVQIDTVVEEVEVLEAPKEVIREDKLELTTSEVEYVEKDKNEVCLKREKVTSTGPPKVA